MDNKWLQACIEDMNEVAQEPTRIRPEHQNIEDRARAYSFCVAGCLQTIAPPSERDRMDPRSVVLHYCAFIPPKIHRALTGLVQSAQDPEDSPADHGGSAKIALIAIERSRAAWIEMAERRLAPIAYAERFVADLSQLAGDLDRLFPKARAALHD